MSALAPCSVARVFGLLVLAAAGLVGMRRLDAPRCWQAAVWLSPLGLASLASPGAWGDYVPVTAVWLLSVIAVRMTRSRLGRAALVAASVFEFFLLGTMPIGDWAPIRLMIPVSAIGAFIMLGLFAFVVASRPSSMAGEVGEPHRDEDRAVDGLREAA